MLRSAYYPCLFELLLELTARQSRVWPPSAPAPDIPIVRLPRATSRLFVEEPLSFPLAGPVSASGRRSGCSAGTLHMLRSAYYPCLFKAYYRLHGSAEPRLAAVHSCARHPVVPPTSGDCTAFVKGPPSFPLTGPISASGHVPDAQPEHCICSGLHTTPTSSSS